jgi:hypothetical protein
LIDRVNIDTVLFRRHCFDQDSLTMNNISLTDMKFIHRRLASAEDSEKRRAGQKSITPDQREESKASKKGGKLKKGSSAAKKGGSKKSGKEEAEEQAGYLLKQRKLLLNNYILTTNKLKVKPIQNIVHQMEINTNVEQSKDDRDSAMGSLLSIISDGDRIGAGNMRALCCAITGRWLSTTTNSILFAPNYELLLHLAINNGDIGSTGATAIAALLTQKECTLRTLRLLSCNVGAVGCQELGNALSFNGGNKSLVELYLDGDETINNSGTTELCNRLELNSSLKVLSLSSCGITSSGMASVNRMLTSIRNGLQYLSLECNTLQGFGMELLCEPSISRSSGRSNGFLSLQVLNVASTGISEMDSLRACKALGQIIRLSKLLKAVDFNLNKITVDSARYMSECLVKARRDGSKIDEFIITTEIDNETFQTLNLDSSIMSSWTSRMKETTKTFRRTPTPSPF